MEHNSNLLADTSYLAVPMLQFFSLPDYSFEELRVPPWVYRPDVSSPVLRQPVVVSLAGEAKNSQVTEDIITEETITEETASSIMDEKDQSALEYPPF
mmetsp:Transcript_9325/g.19269  ORF Transcript_9325/g.19269 Transcript_9325/m.19269 type:complete len:98 (-) Transcript_9325:30-323(-)